MPAKAGGSSGLAEELGQFMNDANILYQAV